MSAPAAAPAGPVTAGPGPTTRPTTTRRPRRATLLVVLGAVLLVVALVVASLGTSDGPLDPGSPAPDGGRAVAQVLGDLGVDVVRTTTSDATDAAVEAAGGDAAVLVVPTSPLSSAQTDRLAALGEAGTDLVLLVPDPDVLATLAPSLRAADEIETAEDVPPQCDVPAAQRAGDATGGGALVEPRDDEDPTVLSCYGLPFGGAPYVTVDGDAEGGDRGDVVVLGQPDVLRNETVDEAGNAALALQTLGARPTLVWYLPDPLDPALAEGDGTVPLSSLVPRGLVRAAQVLAVAGVLLLLWRGRRLGRLVVERLPVVVRAAEAVEGRGRLYRATGARGHAAATLRAASLTRLAGRLGVPVSAGTDAVVGAAAGASGRPRADVAALYRPDEPADDAALVALATALDDLEKEVSSS